ILQPTRCAMFLFRWFRRTRDSNRVDSRKRPARGRRIFRPHVEGLEDRLAPATLTVLDNSDSATDTQSLRFALAHAQSGDTIDFDAAVRTINLSNQTNATGLTIGTDVTITNDLGVGPVTIDGGGILTVFTVNSGVTATLAGLTITHGEGAHGDGIFH